MSCQFHPTIFDTKPPSPTAVLLHLYYLHDPRLGLPRSHHTPNGHSGDSAPPHSAADNSDDEDADADDDSEYSESYDDEELWFAGPSLYVAYECVRVWVEGATAVRELSEHLEDIVSWPIDDMGVQIWHADSKLQPTHTLSQLGWFRQLLPATTASPPSSPYDRLLVCLPADPCVCTHCCRIDFARAKRRVKLVRRHIEGHYAEVVMAEEDEDSDGEGGGGGGRQQGGKGARSKKGGKAVPEDDSWMDDVEGSGSASKAGKEKAGGGKGQQQSKGGGGGNKSGKKKLSKEAQRLVKKEKEEKLERERKAREQRGKEEAARQERAKREAEAAAELERIEREKEQTRQLRREEDEHKRAQQTLTSKAVTAQPAAAKAKNKKASKTTLLDQLEAASTTAKQSRAAHKTEQQQAKSTAASVASSHHINNQTAQPIDSLSHQPPQKQQLSKKQWKKITANSQTTTQLTTPPATNNTVSPTLLSTPTTTTKPVTVSSPMWKGWGSPCTTRATPPQSTAPSLPQSPHSNATPAPPGGMSPYRSFSIASTDDDNSSLHSDSFSLFSTNSALLPPCSPGSLPSHRQTSASSTASTSTVTSPCLSSLSFQSVQPLSPSLPPLFCDRADLPLPAVLNPFTASRGAPGPATTITRTSALWPLSQPQQPSDEELRRRWQDDDDDAAVLQAACSEYSNYADEQQPQQSSPQPQREQPTPHQQWAQGRVGWQHDGSGVPMEGWALGGPSRAAATVERYHDDTSIYTTHAQYRPYKEGLFMSRGGVAGVAGAPVHNDGAVSGGGSPQLCGYMPLVQYVPVYIRSDQPPPPPIGR